MADPGQVTDGDEAARGDLLDQPGPGADPGSAYERAVEEDQVEPDEEEADTPGVGVVYRSGS